MKPQTDQKAQERKLTSAEIMNALLLRICSFHYRPGEILSEAALAAEFQVSRTPVRQVLHQLSFFELVSSVNGVGTVVTEVTREQAIEMSRIRLHLSHLCAEFIDPQRMPAAAEKMLELLEPTKRLLHHPDRRMYAEIGLRMMDIILGIMRPGEFVKLWEQSYYKNCRVSYGLLETHWATCVHLQTREIEAFHRSLNTGDVETFCNVYRSYIAEWGEAAIFPKTPPEALPILPALVLPLVRTPSTASKPRKTRAPGRQ